MPRRSMSLAVRLLAPLLLARGLDAEDSCPSPDDHAPSSPQHAPMTPAKPRVNATMPTLGGRQFWGDVVHFRGWRVQQHVYTRHYRLLDPRDIRFAWGTREQCEAELERQKAARNLPPLSGRAVILAHGIVRSSKSFSQLARQLQDEGCVVVPFDYPSTQVSIPDAAGYLREVIDSLTGVDRIDFVVHSMGGLIVRAYLQQTADNPDPRLHRMVMLGVPNLGARMANIVQTNLMFQTIFGPAGQQLIESDSGLIASLPTPGFEFAIVAGARGTDEGFNPLIPGDDDGVVTVDSARLPGAADSMVVPCIHSFLPTNAVVRAAVMQFLQTGALRAEGERQPIPAAEITTSARASVDAARLCQ